MGPWVMGHVSAICYRTGGPPDSPIAVMVKFDLYSGPTLPDGTVPIVPLRRTWSTSGIHNSRLQLPLKLAWAVTIHKSQGLTLNKAVINIGKKEFSFGLTFAACSRVRHLTDLLFDPPFPFQRLANLANSHRLQERQQEDSRLQNLELNTLPAPALDMCSPISSPSLDLELLSSAPSPPPDCNTTSCTPSPLPDCFITSRTPSPFPDCNMTSRTPSPDRAIPHCNMRTTSPPPDWELASPTPSPPPDWELASPTPSPPPDWELEPLSRPPSHLLIGN